MGEAIKADARPGSNWYESGFARELHIRNNHFAEGCSGGRAGSLISIYSADTEDETVFNLIAIESNEFKTFDPCIIDAGKIDSLIIQKNKIYKSDKYPPIEENNPVIEISNVKHTVFSENTFYAYEPSKISIDEDSQTKLEEKNNRWIKNAITKNEE